MERSTDRYLHKKFKKQLSIEPSNHHHHHQQQQHHHHQKNADGEENIESSSAAAATATIALPSTPPLSSPPTPASQTNQNSNNNAGFTKAGDDVPAKNSNESVPKVSTNSDTSTIVNVTVLESATTTATTSTSNLAKSSISGVNAANVVNEKGEGVTAATPPTTVDTISEDGKHQQQQQQQIGELVDPQSSANSCISYVISKSSRVENQNQPESHYRAASFDTRFSNVTTTTTTEPIANTIPAAVDTSSILENVYSKQYVTSKLVSVDQIGDISSSNVGSIDNNDHHHLHHHHHHHHHHNQEDSSSCSTLADSRNVESKFDSNHAPELTSSEKSSGGKYICSYCNLACSKPSVLQKHIRAHTNERPYPCVSCGFSFKTRSNLYKHCRSRTHANRVMGNKAQEIHNEADTDSQNRMEYIDQGNAESGGEDAGVMVVRAKDAMAEETGNPSGCERTSQDIKTKPYKPRFHTAKAFFDNVPSKDNSNQKDGEDQKVPDTVQNRPSNPDLLSLHINEVINKNNAIVNSNESYLLRKRSVDNSHSDSNESSSHRHGEVSYVQSPGSVAGEERQNEEPLNLTNKNRKRCMSEVAEPAMHTSLIKELLLKNLYADTNMQCPHCKMIFQTVTELELHKMRSCKGFTKTGARYSRSSSVNVASILTKNKNAFDNIPYLQNAAFPLKSPGPFLGKTRLVEGDKNKSFSFDDGLPAIQNTMASANEILRTTLRYSISPLTIQHDRAKKAPVKLFGGEVKITHASGETKSFKIDSKEGEKYGGDHFVDYGGRLSENRVVKSSLQSGGTVLQNKPSYNPKQDSLGSSPDVIRVYENTTLSPSIDIASLEKTKFNFDRHHHHHHHHQEPIEPGGGGEYSRSSSELLVRPSSDAMGSSNFNSGGASYKYTNIVDFSQKAVKLLAPNLKQPNLAVPGVPLPTKIPLPHTSSSSLGLEVVKHQQDLTKMFVDALPPVSRAQAENERGNVISFSTVAAPRGQDHIENIQFAQKQILLHQKMSAAAEPMSPGVAQSPSLCNPVNLLVNGKVVRYVPGMPGPVAADVPLDVAYGGRLPAPSFRPQKAVETPPPPPYTSNHNSKPSQAMEIARSSPIDRGIPETGRAHYSSGGGNQLLQMEKRHLSEQHDHRVSKSPKFGALEVKTAGESPMRVSEMKSPNLRPGGEIKSPTVKPDARAPNELPPRKFARPNTLALKPSVAAHKQHHGLTPTMFNQILISPDTPRVAKKYMQHFLHGNYFSYLGLKSSTKPVYCTLNKTQPTYVPHFKKLSMYSEWRQQDTKTDKLYVSGYDSRQKHHRYVTAGKATEDLVVHSSYKYTVPEASSSKADENAKANSILGGYESNEDYTYVRGRGRGRYVCDQCGIRCKKPSMLKKHIRTHTNDRPYTCSHCNFSFKTKGNLTKHMKSKAHTKNYAASNSSNSSAQQSGTQSSESDTDDSGMDSSDESTRQQEHEAAYGLLSLSQKTTQNITSGSQTDNFSSHSSPVGSISIVPVESPSSFMNTEQVTQVNNSNFARNKILDQQAPLNINKMITDIPSTTSTDSKEMQNLVQFLGKSNTSRPLTYPYTSDMIDDEDKLSNEEDVTIVSPAMATSTSHEMEKEQRILPALFNHKQSVPHSPVESRRIPIPITITYDPSYLERYKTYEDRPVTPKSFRSTTPVVKINDRIVLNNVPYNNSSFSSDRKRKMQQELPENASPPKLQRLNSEPEAMDLSMPSLTADKSPSPEIITAVRYNGASPQKEKEVRISLHAMEVQNHHPRAESALRSAPRNMEYKSIVEKSTVGDNEDRPKMPYKIARDSYRHNGTAYEVSEMPYREKEGAMNLKTTQPESGERININYVIQENHPSIITTFTEVPNSFSPMDYDNSAMETLADVATKQVKLEKNTLAKSVASEYLKLATKHELQANEGPREANSFASTPKEVNELIVKPEENRSCTICAKNFSKPSQLRLHMNIHYLERPFRCDPCSVSFRTKGHLQKHERSASHNNKLSSSPLLTSSEPRPFKCSDCNIAFRIHGHLAKHLRSKMHIMKLECLAKIPFGLYAELERANSLLTEINTTDGDQCLESLKALARKVFMNDPGKLNQLEVSLNNTDASDS